MKIGLLYQDIASNEIPWQKNNVIYYRTARRIQQMAIALVEAGYDVVIFSSLKKLLDNKKNIDIVFPCIECCFDRNTNGFIPTILQMNGIPFIGNDSYINTIVSDKYLFENIAKSLGINTPNSKIFYKQNYGNILEYIQEIQLPCILKYQYGSMSYHTKKISSSQQLKKYLKYMVSQNNGAILCEQYIEGKEISVPVIGTAPDEKILSVIEYTDSEKNPLEIYDEFWKGKNDCHVQLNVMDQSLLSIKKIVNWVHKIYQFLNYKDYARFDFRMDYNGKPYLLEGNPLPALAYESAFDPLSYGESQSFSMILSEIVENAINRYDLG